MRGVVDAVPAVFVVVALAGCGGGGTSTTSTEASSGPQGSEASGERSIETYGSEAVGSTRRALIGSFRAHLGAIAGEDYPTACSYLAARVRHSLEQVGEGSGEGQRCPEELSKVLAPTAPVVAREMVKGTIVRVRVRESMAFIVFHAPGARLYVLPLTEEGGRWKANTAVPSVLAPSSTIFEE